MKNELKNWTFPIIIFILIIVLYKPIIKYIPKWFVENYNESFITEKKQISKNVDNRFYTSTQDKTGPIGDTYGGTLGPTIALLAAFLTFLAFWIQYRSNKQQENYIKQQRFEDTFFRLLDHYKKNIDSIDIRNPKNISEVKGIGYESFKFMYEDMVKLIGKNKEIENINNEYHHLQDHYKHDLHHYFRFLYHILKFIKQSNISENEKFRYSSILRATISAHELVLIFYNCLHKNGKSHFKPLIEEFSFLKNIDTTLIINKMQMNEYHKLAFASSSDRANLLTDWRTEK